MLTEGVVLGHHISSKGIKVDPANIEIITSLSPPTTQKEVRSFMGHAGYYRRFIANFTKIATPLFKLLAKDIGFCWDQHCQAVFDTLKTKLSSTPILRGLDWYFPFHIQTDAFDTLGGVLGQKENQSYYAIYFISKNLTPAELNYTVTEKEFLAQFFFSVSFGSSSSPHHLQVIFILNSSSSSDLDHHLIWIIITGHHH